MSTGRWRRKGTDRNAMKVIYKQGLDPDELRDAGERYTSQDRVTISLLPTELKQLRLQAYEAKCATAVLARGMIRLGLSLLPDIEVSET